MQKTKEFQFSPNISAHDLEIKIQKIRRLINKSFEIRACVIFKGRAIIHQEIGFNILEAVVDSLIDIAKLKQSLILKGKSLSIILVPNKRGEVHEDISST